MAYQDSPGQERDHLDPTDLAVAGKSAGDIESVEETVEDLEDLEGLGGLAVVDFGAEQGAVPVPALEKDEIRSEEAEIMISNLHTN